MAKPTVTTIKRLFAHCGNECAFPGCTTAVFDPTTSALLADVCHIKGSKPGSARYDPLQSDKERHGYDNLVVLCGVHHSIVDQREAQYTVDALIALKSKHELSSRNRAVDPEWASRFARAYSQTNNQSSVVNINEVHNSQVANTIINKTILPKDMIRLKCGIHVDLSREMVQKAGGPALVVQVTCKSTQPARLQGIGLCVEGEGFLESFQPGWENSFGHDPHPDHAEELEFCLHPVRAMPSDGLVLQKGDTATFFIGASGIKLGFLTAQPPSALKIRALFSNESTRYLLKGLPIRNALDWLTAVCRVVPPGRSRRDTAVRVHVVSRRPPEVNNVGKVNSKPVVLPVKYNRF